MQAEQVERREFNYVRHGTQVVTANLNLATGQLLTPTIAQSRTEADFVEHIAQLIQTDPKAGFIIGVCPQLEQKVGRANRTKGSVSTMQI